ncbi:hypothetical protein LINPERHAP1_LOCUS9054 [Linum perenne]
MTLLLLLPEPRHCFFSSSSSSLRCGLKLPFLILSIAAITLSIKSMATIFPDEALRRRTKNIRKRKKKQ